MILGCKDLGCGPSPVKSPTSRKQREVGRFLIQSSDFEHLLVVGSLRDQVVDDAMGFIDVLQRTMPQTVRELVIFSF
jgi:hypothetical protein